MKCMPLLLAAATIACALEAQGTGSIQGRVTDSSDAVIPGATVQVKGPSGLTRTATTDAAGDYAINDLPRGSYSIEVDRPGFAPFRGDPFEVSGPRPRVINVTLKLADTRQEVTVQRSSPWKHSTNAVLQYPADGAIPVIQALNMPVWKDASEPGTTEACT
jgi:hypothetical protein